jgi:two-component system response regulator FixJ
MSHTVFIVDDDAAVRKALCLLFKSVQLEAEAFVSGEDFLKNYQPLAGEARACIVADVRLPGMSGLELQEEMARRNIRIPIIVISGHTTIVQAVHAMQLGALTVLEKPMNEQELIDTVHRALKVSPTEDMPGKSIAIDRYRGLLTERQREVFDLLLKGLPTKAVARQLGLSHRTVETHRANILERLQIHSFSDVLQQLLAMTSQPEAQSHGQR